MCKKIDKISLENITHHTIRVELPPILGSNLKEFEELVGSVT